MKLKVRWGARASRLPSSASRRTLVEVNQLDSNGPPKSWLGSALSTAGSVHGPSRHRLHTLTDHRLPVRIREMFHAPPQPIHDTPPRLSLHGPLGSSVIGAFEPRPGRPHRWMSGLIFRPNQMGGRIGFMSDEAAPAMAPAGPLARSSAAPSGCGSTDKAEAARGWVRPRAPAPRPGVPRGFARLVVWPGKAAALAGARRGRDWPGPWPNTIKERRQKIMTGPST